MNEGEFKKRIDRESYRHGFSNIGGIDVMMCNDSFNGDKTRREVDVVQLETIIKILEDAKQDLPFPITDFVRKLHPTSPISSDEKHKNLMQLIDWFTKWLDA